MTTPAPAQATADTVVTMPLAVREATILPPDASRPGVYRAVFSTGATVRRSNRVAGIVYDETLSMLPGHVRLERLNSGTTPILLDHLQLARNVVGVVIRAWLEDGKGWIEFRVEEGSAEADGLRRKLDQRILVNVSAGYRVHKLVRSGKKNGDVPELVAEDWEPMEVSLVAVPADPGAGLRSDTELTPCQIVDGSAGAVITPQGERRMSTPANDQVVIDNPAPQAQPNADQARAANDAVTAAAVAAAVASERKRTSEVRLAFRQANLTDEAAEAFIAEGKTADEARSFALSQLGAAGDKNETRTDVQVIADNADPVALRSAFVEGVAASIDPTLVTAQGRAVEFRGLSLCEAYATYLEARGERVPAKREALIERMLHTTSDFPIMLGNSLNRIVGRGFELAAPTYREIAAQKTFTDFRPHFITRPGALPGLKPLLEGGEIKSGSLSDISQESIRLTTNAIKLGVTRPLLVNDNMGEIQAAIGSYGPTIAADENAAVYAALANNRVLSDKKRAFDVSRGNVNTAPADMPTADVLDVIRVAFRKRVLNGRKLNLVPKTLLIRPEQETAAEKLMTAIAAIATGEVNVFSGKFKIIVENELADDNGWYALAAKEIAAILSYGYLNGKSGPSLETKKGWDMDGVEFRLIHDFAAELTDWVGGQKILFS